MTIATRTPAIAARAARLLQNPFKSSGSIEAAGPDDALPASLKAALLALPLLESLEGRQMLTSTATLSGTTLNLAGNTAHDNTFDVRLSNNKLSTTVNGVVKTFTYTKGMTIKITGSDTVDKVTIADNVIANTYVDAKGGNDSIRTGGGSDTIYAGAGKDSVNGGLGTDFAYDAETWTGLTPLADKTTIPTTPNVPVTPPVTTQSAAIKLTGSSIYVTGSKTAANVISVTLDSTGKKILVKSNSDAATFNVVDVKWVYVTTGTGADKIDVATNVSARFNIHSGAGKDSIHSGAGSDSIFAEGDDDLVDGGGGNDSIDAGAGNDVVYGGAGLDTLNGSDGNDSLDGGADNDTVIGGAGTDAGFSAGTRQTVELTPTSTKGWLGSTTTSTPTTGGGTTTGGTTGGGTTTGGTTGGATGASTPPSTGNVANPVARITSPTGLSIMAGVSVHVDGLSSTLNSGQPTTARYEWDFGDSGSRFNTLVGFTAAHVYAKPGNYTVTLKVINEGGKTNTTTTTVNVSGDSRNVIYVSNSGNDSNPGTIDRPIRSIARAAALISNANDTKLLFQAGGTYDISTQPLSIHGHNVILSSYGSGNKPVLRYVGPRDTWRSMVSLEQSSEDVTVNGFTFDSIYTGTDGSDDNMPQAIWAAGKNLTSMNNTFNDVGFDHNVRDVAVGFLAQDDSSPKVTGLRDYFMWAEGNYMVALGNFVANSTRQHDIRFAGADKVLVYGNTLNNLDREGSDSSDVAKGTVVLQKGSYYYVANNNLTGPAGFGPLGKADGLTEKSARTTYGVFEGNVEDGAFEVRHGSEHIVVRNNIFKEDDNTAVTIEGYNSSYGRGSQDITIVSNTGINTGTMGNFMVVDEPIDGVKVVDNLYVAPNLVTGSFASAGIGVIGSNLSSFTQITGNNWGSPTILSWAEGGINWIGAFSSSERSIWQSPTEWNAYAQVGTDQFTDIRLDSSYRPYTGQVGLNATAVGGVFTDFYGNYRPSTGWTVGAVQA